MARIAGIKVEKSVSGKIKAVTFNFKKHGELLNPILEELGVIEIDAKREEFMKKFNNGITGDVLRKRVHAHIETLPWKK